MIQPGQARGAVLGWGGGLGLKGLWGGEKVAGPANARSGEASREGARSDRGGGVCWEGLG